jgi:hypothetical protein
MGAPPFIKKTLNFLFNISPPKKGGIFRRNFTNLLKCYDFKFFMLPSMKLQNGAQIQDGRQNVFIVLNMQI